MSGSSLILAAPFAGLLLTIALVPLFAQGFWHRHYGKCAAFWALAFIVADAAIHGPAATVDVIVQLGLIEYLPFTLLLSALFAVAGGLRLTGMPRGEPWANTAMLAFGAAMASIIGTTGAVMVMIRPMIHANRHRRRTAHIFVFFILLVGNVGGALTPLGDPPLFLGYLAGVPFFWPLMHLWAPTTVVALGLLSLFYGLDRGIFHHRDRGDPPAPAAIQKIGIEGGINLVLIGAVIAAMLLRGIWRPSLTLMVLHTEWRLGDIVTDVLLLVIGLLSLSLTDEQVRKANEFSWAPMIEVAILFAAIFVTIAPVMAIIGAGSGGPAGPLLALLFSDGAPNDRVFFWATGLLSAVLDNAPTYLVFFGFAGNDARDLAGPLAPTLAAISAGAVFCGALTYIGNAPNFMVKALVENHGIRMPGFIAYVGWAVLCLGPWLILVDLIFLT